MPTPQFEFLDQARKEFWAALMRGDEVMCKCCERMGNAYSVGLGEVRLTGLIWLSFAKPEANGFVDVPKGMPRTLTVSPQLATLRHWGLIQHPVGLEGKEIAQSKYWRITQKGKDFVNGRISLPQTHNIFNNKIMWSSKNNVHIGDCFRRGFSYEQVFRELQEEAEKEGLIDPV